jgi:diguanylate cyclase (GGDEF)-like protein|tara:strand:+ start:5016 stop:5957 length:942 start_codon:yes stop_codon:yes gene_type:complete
MFSLLKLHLNKILLIISLLIISTFVSLSLGQITSWDNIDWLDVAGEGGCAIALAIWIIFILGSRPQGRVSDLLTLGLGFMLFAFWQDTLDEFIQLPNSLLWDQMESIAMPLGILLLTYGLYHWHQEQLALNHQLRKRELVFREHRAFDQLTLTGQFEYLSQQLTSHKNISRKQSLVLLILDINDFSEFNRQFGNQEGDRLLLEICELILLNLRQQDLICRYAGDRFAIILPDTSLTQGRQIAAELKQAIKHFAFKVPQSSTSQFQSVSIGCAHWQTEKDNDLALETTEKLLERANLALLKDKPIHLAHVSNLA